MGLSHSVTSFIFQNKLDKENEGHNKNPLLTNSSSTNTLHSMLYDNMQKGEVNWCSIIKIFSLYPAHTFHLSCLVLRTWTTILKTKCPRKVTDWMQSRPYGASNRSIRIRAKTRALSIHSQRAIVQQTETGKTYSGHIVARNNTNKNQINRLVQPMGWIHGGQHRTRLNHKQQQHQQQQQPPYCNQRHCKSRHLFNKLLHLYNNRRLSIRTRSQTSRPRRHWDARQDSITSCSLRRPVYTHLYHHYLQITRTSSHREGKIWPTINMLNLYKLFFCLGFFFKYSVIFTNNFGVRCFFAYL